METLEKLEKEVVVVNTIKMDNGTYTVFKNHDEELVKKIKAVKLDDESFSTWKYGEGCVVEKVMENGQLFCKNPEGKYFTYEKEDYDQRMSDRLLNKINELYPVWKYWNDNFGIIGSGYERWEVYGHEESNKKAYDALGKVGYKPHRTSVSTYMGVEVSSDVGGKWGSIMFCWFDTDGNYVNRDYNLDVLNAKKNKILYGKDLYKEVVDAIPDIEYTYHNGRWFAQDFAYVLLDVEDGLGFYLYKVDRRATGKYGNRGERVFSCPKRNTEQNTKADIIKAIKPKLEIVMKHLDNK